MTTATLELSGHSVAIEFERRASRAAFLVDSAPSARDALIFASVLLNAQGALARQFAELSPLLGRMIDDARIVAPLARTLLERVEELGPPALAEIARERLEEDNAVAEERLITFWSGSASGRDDYLEHAIVRPYAEVLRARQIAPDRIHEPRCCGFCGGAPMIAIRRPLPASETTAEYRVCSLCGGEWIAKRGVCAACGEDDAQKLPIYTSEMHPDVRIEGCETCHCYIKSIDLTKDARPIAEVDDLVSVSMDLWAADQGLTRIEPGLAGV